MAAAWKLTLLTTSHLGAIVGVALLMAAAKRSRLQQEAWADPLYRMGLHFTELGRAPARGLPPLEQELEAVQRVLGPPAGLVVRLIAELRGLDAGGQLDTAAAERTCRELGWPRCDEDALRVMRRAVLQ